MAHFILMFTLDVRSPVYKVIVLSKREEVPQFTATTNQQVFKYSVPQVFSSSSSQVAAQTEKYG